MKKRIKDISSSSKKQDRERNIYSNSKKSLSKQTEGKRFFKKPTSAKGVFLLVGKAAVCCLLLSIIGLSIIITALTVYVMKEADAQSGINLDKESIMKTGVTTVYGTDSQNNVVPLSTISSGTTRLWCDLDKVPSSVKNAIIAIEDEKFYEHDGVNFQRTFVAFTNMFLHFGINQGGSTITQQLVKN